MELKEILIADKSFGLLQAMASSFLVRKFLR